MLKKWLILFILSMVCVNAEILFQENFEDTNFASRGWYDHLQGTVTAAEHVAGSTSAFECVYTQGQSGCAQGKPGRHLFTGTETLYLSYWIKYSVNYIGSGQPYHPHEFYFLTNKDPAYQGPYTTFLTVYVEHHALDPQLVLQDAKNVNPGCTIPGNDPIDKCDSYNFGEQRSIGSCNLIQGDFDQRDCYQEGAVWHSYRTWDTDQVYWTDSPGPYYKNDWHFIEALFEMNTIQNGIGQVDGKIRYWYDGELLISSDNIIMRTGQHPDMEFNQFMIGPHIGDGSPVTQTMWVDNLTVSTHRLGHSNTECGDGTCDADEDCTSCEADCGACPIDCVHEADLPVCDGCIDTTELSDYIGLWKSGSVEMPELIEAIRLWKVDCP